MENENKASLEDASREGETLADGRASGRLKRVPTAGKGALVGEAGTFEDDDINIFYFIDVLIKNAKKITSLALILFLIFCGFVAIYLYQKKQTAFTRHSLELSLQFTGVNDMKNPDGSAFNPNDIVSGDILTELYGKYKISGVGLSQFVSAFSSSYRSVIVPAPEPKDAEGKKGNKEKLVEMINPSMVTIYMDAHRETFKQGAITNEQIKKIMEEIPALWSKKFTALYLSRNIPNPFISVNFDQLPTFEYGDVYSILDSNLKQFVAGMDKLGESFDFSSYRSAKHDMTLEDAYFVVKTGLQRELDAWYFFPKVAGIARDKEKRITFLKSNIARLSAKKKVLADKNNHLQNLLSILKNPLSQSRLFNEDTQQVVRNKSEIGTVDANILERVFKSGESSANSEYVITIAKEMLNGISDLAELNMEVSNGKSELAALEGRNQNLSLEKQKVISSRIESELVILLQNYKKWVSICIDIARESIDNKLRQQKGLYSITSLVKSKLVNPSSSKALFKEFVIFPALALALIFAGFCILLIAKTGYRDYQKKMS